MRIRGGWVRGGCAVLAVLGMATSVHATTIVDDSWVDGGRTNGDDPSDADWWASTSGSSTSGSAIEVSSGSLGLVSGTSGRGIHGTFAAQTLAAGDSLKATFTFATPTTVVAAPGLGAAFKIGLFDTLGNNGLAADLAASSGSPNAIYDPLPGYMMDFDINTGATANIQFREKSPVPGSTGLLLSTTTGFANLAGGGSSYAFAASTTYTAVFLVTKTAGGSLDLTGSLSSGPTLLSTFTTNDSTASTSTFDLLGFHVNANVFGSTNAPNTANNGIDFSNIKIEFVPVPEPSSMALLAIGLGLAARRRR